jgi:hypothetical protein
MKERLTALQRLRSRVGSNAIQAIKEVKLCDYYQIDRLPSQQRQLVNLFFQEI